jgi:hypothetical protein
MHGPVLLPAVEPDQAAARRKGWNVTIATLQRAAHIMSGALRLELITAAIQPRSAAGGQKRHRIPITVSEMAFPRCAKIR